MISGGYVSKVGTDLVYKTDVWTGVYLYESSEWKLYTIPAAGVSIACESGLSPDTKYFLYLYRAAGVLTAELVTTEPTTQDGIYVQTGDKARLLVAFAYTDGSGKILDTTSVRSFANLYNCREVTLSASDTEDSWEYSSTTWREARGGTATRCYFCLPPTGIAELVASCYAASSETSGMVEAEIEGIAPFLLGHGNPDVLAGIPGVVACVTGLYAQGSALAHATATGGGYGYAYVAERCAGAGTVTFCGDAGAAEQIGATCTVRVMA